MRPRAAVREPSPGSPAEPGRRRLGLLIGVGEYPRIGESARLLGPANDVRALAAVLEQRFGFAARDLRLLVDADATRNAILGALDRLVEEAGDGDRVVIHFSGHGSQVPSRRPDEPDGLDETLVPHDGVRGVGIRGNGMGSAVAEEELRDIRDGELFARLQRLESRGAFVTLSLDCCHGGHAHRRWPRDQARPRDAARARGGTRVRRLPPVVDPKAGPGQARRSGTPSAGLWSWRHSNRRVVLTACRDDQEAAERAVRSGTLPGATHFGAWTWALLRVLHALPASEGGSENGAEIRAASVREVFERASALVASSDPDQWPQLFGDRERAIFGVDRIRSDPYLLARRLDRQGWTLPAGLAQGLAEGSRWRLVPFAAETVEAEPAVLHRLGALESELRTAEGSSLPAEAEVARAELVEPARPWLGASLLARNPGSMLDGCLELRLWSRRPGGEFEPATGPEGFAELEEGDFLGLELEHDHEDGIYIYVLDFGLSGSLSQVHPEEGATEFLLPGMPLRIGMTPDDEIEVRFPPDFGAGTGAETRAEEGVGLVRAVGTTAPTDFGWLTHPGDSCAGEAHADAVRSGRVGAGDWTVCDRRIRLRRRAPTSEELLTAEVGEVGP